MQYEGNCLITMFGYSLYYGLNGAYELPWPRSTVNKNKAKTYNVVTFHIMLIS